MLQIFNFRIHYFMSLCVSVITSPMLWDRFYIFSHNIIYLYRTIQQLIIDKFYL